jgi:DNA invertase Pin-like site-specific DNA recombinase
MMRDWPLGAGSAVWAYLRVSGEDQAERGTPIAGQRAEVERYCQAHSLALSRWFVDEARPGGSTVGRDRFEELIRLAHQDGHAVDGVIFWSWARFARDQVDANFCKSDLRRLGYTLI